MQRIVIMPSFAESHLIECQIPNIIDVLHPTVIIYNEGLFPCGPENLTTIDEDFKREFCYKDTSAGFDFEDTERIILKYREKYPHVSFHLNVIEYPKTWNADQCYQYAVSNFSMCNVAVEAGDIIFPIEPDVFHHEHDSDTITEMIYAMRPNTAIRTHWIDFLETQYYTENIHEGKGGRPKSRKIAVCFGDMTSYLRLVSNFVSQDYSSPEYVYKDIRTYHYCWFRFAKWRDLRYRLIQRSNPSYWEDFDKGLKQIRMNSVINRLDAVVIRPNEGGMRRYAYPINLNHPRHIRKHQNYVKYDTEE